MQRRGNDRHAIVTCLFAMAAPMLIGASAEAREIVVNGLPCNDLCQDWMGYNKHEGSVEPSSEKVGSGVRPFVRHGPSIASGPHLKPLRHKMDVVKVEHRSPIIERSVPEAPKVTASAKRVRQPTRVVLKDIPLPLHRPETPSDRPTVAIAHPEATTARSSQPFRRALEAVKEPETVARRAEPLSPVSSRVPDRLAITGKPDPRTESALVAPPTRAVTPMLPPKPPQPEVPRVAARHPMEDAVRPPVETGAQAPSPVARELMDHPTNPVPLSPLPAASPPPAVVASLPPSIDTESSLQNDSQQKGDTQENALRPSSPTASTSLSVKIGQIIAEPRGTDVHVLVVNAMPRAIRDVDVRCRARDAQGLQVAEVSSRITIVAPSDVTFGQVVFPSAITTEGNEFICEIAKVAIVEDNVN